jgi:hypothetical protein
MSATDLKIVPPMSNHRVILLRQYNANGDQVSEVAVNLHLLSGDTLRKERAISFLTGLISEMVDGDC